MEDNICIMPFLNDSKDFALGFECGQIWNRLENEEELIEAIIHSESVGQIKMMCNCNGYKFDMENLNESWVKVIAKLIKVKIN